MGCFVIGCFSPVYSSGLCSKHYNRKRTTGTTNDGPRARTSLEVRFWKNVERKSEKECWPWIGQSLNRGYGYIGIGGRNSGKELSHRISWVFKNGKIPNGKVVRHKCHNRLCCNPNHLQLGTQADNVADMWVRKNGPKGNARLTKKQIAKIRKDTRSSREVAPIYGVSDAHIRSIRQWRCWK